MALPADHAVRRVRCWPSCRSATQLPDYLAALLVARRYAALVLAAIGAAHRRADPAAGARGGRDDRACCWSSPGSRARCTASAGRVRQDTFAGYAGLISPFTLVDGAGRVPLGRPAREEPVHRRDRHARVRRGRRRAGRRLLPRCCCLRYRRVPIVMTRPCVLDAVSRWFGNVVAVNDVTMRIGPGRHRPARPQRRRQVHPDPHDGGLPRAVLGHRDARRRAALAQPEQIYREIGLVPEREDDVRRRDRLGVRARQRAAAPAARPRGGGPSGARDGGDDRRPGPRHRAPTPRG